MLSGRQYAETMTWDHYVESGISVPSNRAPYLSLSCCLLLHILVKIWSDTAGDDLDVLFAVVLNCAIMLFIAQVMDSSWMLSIRYTISVVVLYICQWRQLWIDRWLICIYVNVMLFKSQSELLWLELMEGSRNLCGNSKHPQWNNGTCRIGKTRNQELS